MKVRNFSVVIVCISFLFVCGWVQADEKAGGTTDKKDTEQGVLKMSVDFSGAIGKMRALHGVVNGPLDWGGITDVSKFHKQAGFPYTHLNAPHWYSPDVVDIHCIFPNFDADANDPNSYYFERTDTYIKSVLDTGAKIVWRLGESPGWYMAPPKDFDKWAKICVNIIRHYNGGWAKGFHYNIQYWQIWNEPEMVGQWTGTMAQYFEFYRVAVTAIKAYDKSLKVGGPAAYAEISPTVKPFLEYCRDKKVPFDFFSWHRYVASPKVIADAVTNARKILDEYGFKETESHLSEWHYMKYDIAAELHTKDPNKYPTVRAKFNELAGPEGAAYCGSVLMLLQDRPVDKVFYYTGDTDRYGLFDHFGVPHKTYYSFRAFNELMKTPNRVKCEGMPDDVDSIVMCAGMADDGKSAGLMVSNFKGKQQAADVALQNLKWTGHVEVQVYAIDDKHDFEIVRQEKMDAKDLTLNLDIAAPCVRYVHLKQLAD